ncbi:DUF4113 domain-containing protein [Vibrio splendidus]|uniref:Y-family DNA polymerase n=1 Tax=Vibrio TaxID=662 RepID=UPI0002E15ABE|nr:MULTISPECIES: DUF4113 domain-containing protein [Vibrio]OEF80538.1 nucleotidyltransferase [Vibrio cyclitrophicus 1F111]PMO98212.1 nucleotidyltransferase [Vibrio splendidus]PMP29684.1 nucleotidyltransferase [Vibrio splendidus]PMP36323.1 nucleotidyltransferase [Vibrio splendidus]PMP46000.1 nucleotidyltransferase [Vibrio splendidus]
MYGLIDGTRFYSESTSIYKPEQKSLPVLVTAGQGISIAANRACSTLGIQKFRPIWENIDLLRLHQGRVYKANFNTFSHISDRFMTSVEQAMQGSSSFRYSVDELFISLTHLHSINVCLDDFILELRQRVYRETGVPVGAGVGSTLTLAKVASWAGKNQPGFKGQCCLIHQKQIDSILSKMPVGKVWNIGGAYQRHLKNEGISTALELKRCDPKTYQKRYSINIANVISELNGVSVLSYSDIREKKKQIWSTSSYRDRLRETDMLFGEIAHHCAEVMTKVRSQKSEVKTLSVFISTGKYDKCLPYYRRIDINLNTGLTDTGQALSQVRTVFESLAPKDITAQPIYKVAVGAVELLDGEKKQFDLFEEASSNKLELNRALDTINARFGKGTLTFGSQKRGYSEQNGSIEFERLENYYTHSSDLLTVKCI